MQGGRGLAGDLPACRGAKPGQRPSRRGGEPGAGQQVGARLDRGGRIEGEPGFGGQHFLDLVLPKVRRARDLVGGPGGSIWVQVDGGVTDETIGRCAEAGADMFVAGSAVFGATDPAAAVTELRRRADLAARQAWPD